MAAADTPGAVAAAAAGLPGSPAHTLHTLSTLHALRHMTRLLLVALLVVQGGRTLPLVGHSKEKHLSAWLGAMRAGGMHHCSGARAMVLPRPNQWEAWLVGLTRRPDS